MPDKSPERCERCGDPLCPMIRRKVPSGASGAWFDNDFAAMQTCNQNRIARALAEIADDLGRIDRKLVTQT